MKKVFVANKYSYGSEFYDVCDSLEALKRAIVAHELYFEDEGYTDDMYTEELFKEHSENGEYRLFEVNLHPDEKIAFGSYDGQSWFHVEKIDPNILSTYRQIREE